MAVKFYTEYEVEGGDTIILPNMDVYSRSLSEMNDFYLQEEKDLKETVEIYRNMKNKTDEMSKESDKLKEKAERAAKENDSNSCLESLNGMQLIAEGVKQINKDFINKQKETISNVKGIYLGISDKIESMNRGIDEYRNDKLETIKQQISDIGKKISDNYKAFRDFINKAKESVKGFNERLGLLREDAKENLLKDKDKILEAGTAFAGAIETFGKETVSKTIEAVNQKKDDMILNFIKGEIETIGKDEIIETLEEMDAGELKNIIQLSDNAIDIMMEKFENETDVSKKMELATEICDYTNIKFNTIHALNQMIETKEDELAEEFEKTVDDLKEAIENGDFKEIKELIVKRDSLTNQYNALQSFGVIEDDVPSMKPIEDFLKNNEELNIDIETEVIGTDDAILQAQHNALLRKVSDCRDYLENTFGYQKEIINEEIKNNNVEVNFSKEEETVDERIASGEIKDKIEKMEDIFSDSKKEQEYNATKGLDEQVLGNDDAR